MRTTVELLEPGSARAATVPAYLTWGDLRAVHDGGTACVWATRNGVTARGWLDRDGLCLASGYVADPARWRVESRH